ncbi:MAG: glycerophosphodiester phosphodiesterase [Actinomyces dentalis]
MSNHDDSDWQSPSDDSADRESPRPRDDAPRFGAYGSPPPGRGDAGYPVPPAFNDAGWGAAPGGFFLAPKPGIIPLRPLSIGEIISGAFESLRANPRAMFLPSLIVLTATGALSAVLNYLGASFLLSRVDDLLNSSDVRISGILPVFMGSFASQMVGALLTALATTILTGLLIVAVSRSVLGRIATPGEVWERTRGRILPLIGQTLLITLITVIADAIIVVIGVVLIVIIAASVTGPDPGAGAIVITLLAALALTVIVFIAAAFLVVRLSLAPAALMLENTGVVEGIGRSWALTRGSFWRVLGILVLAGLITGLVTGTLSFGLGMVLGVISVGLPAAQPLVSAVTVLLTSVLSALVLPFTAAVTALTYIDLRMRTEGLDVELRQAAGV